MEVWVGEPGSLVPPTLLKPNEKNFTYEKSSFTKELLRVTFQRDISMTDLTDLETQRFTGFSIRWKYCCKVEISSNTRTLLCVSC